MTARLAAAVLGLEALLVFFGTLVAATLSDLSDALVWSGGAVLAIACIVAAGLVRRPGGIALGWAVQAAVVATGFWVPAMFVMGTLFAALWGWLVWVGRRIDRDRASWASAD